MAPNKNLLRYAVRHGEYHPALGIDIMRKGNSKLLEEVLLRIRMKEKRYRDFDKRVGKK